MKTEIIACKTIQQEVELAIQMTGVDYPVHWLEAGLHNVNKKLHDTLQAVLDSLHCDRVLLALGVCGNAVSGLQVRDYELIMPRVDDCVSLLLGNDKRRAIGAEKVTYFLTKGWLQVKGDFAIGRSFDRHAIEQFANEKETYVYDILWHHKSLALQVKDTRHGFPLSARIGVNHWAQWGGTSTNPKIGVQPHSFKDLLRVIGGRSGGDDATFADQDNVLGAHYGTYDFKLTYTHDKGSLTAYHQHYFNDLSGMVFENGTDGLWGGELTINGLPWLKKVIVEYVNTRDQSGPFHFIWFDHEKHPGVGGGGDDYYNNGEYRTGFTYANQAIGSPLLISPAHNDNGDITFRHNRIRDWHFAAEGALSTHLSYRLLFTKMNSWGTCFRPLLQQQSGTSSLLELSYQHLRWASWQCSASVGLDTGSLLGDHVGFGLSITKRGILKRWE